MQKRWGYRLLLIETIEHIYFKMHGLKEISKMVEKNCFMPS